MRYLLSLLFLALVSTLSPVAAQTVEDSVIAQLRALGYDQISGRKTLLGRVMITGSKDGYQREIVINPRTGEILRDYNRYNPPAQRPVLIDDGDQSGRLRSPVGAGGAGGVAPLPPGPPRPGETSVPPSGERAPPPGESRPPPPDDDSRPPSPPPQ